MTRWPLLCALLLVALPAAAAIKVELRGVEDEVRRNVETFLSVQRYRERDDIDADTISRLFNRIDGEVREALRPFGYYQPEVRAQLKPQDKGWLIDIDIAPGEPVRVRHVAIQIEGPGADDPAFEAIRSQRALREGMRLNHGTYEQVKGELIRAAAGNGYLAARLVPNPLLVDVANHSARIDLAIETGPRYSFGAISIEQSVIRPQLMRRYLRFREGEPYSVEQLLRTQFALDDSLYFSAVEVAPGEPDAATLTVPVRITANKNDRQLSLGGGYGTDTSFRGTLGWTDTRLNDRGHRLRFEIKGSQITRRIDARYDIPIGDPALERFSLLAVNKYENLGDLDTNETSVTPSITRVRGRWQWITQVAATRTSTDDGQTFKRSNLLVPGLTVASVPEGFLGESLFSRTLYAEVIGSQKALGSDSDFVRLLVQSERQIDLTRKWHLQLRGEAGTSLVKNFSQMPGIYRFFAGGDRSVRGFAYQSLSPQELVLQRDGTLKLTGVGGKHLLVGSVEVVRDLPLNLAVATFFDAGNAFDHFGDRLEYAGGVGLRYRLPVVSLGIDVAKPLSTGGNLRLHLNITPKL
ncbi:MAG TPA: BamA/TamA family outer membrane protein [Steroidobacteraceae bacterium]|nr:BamA/TamA family outer membrane protein [Steroidobacteraceae bacterium]